MAIPVALAAPLLFTELPPQADRFEVRMPQTLPEAGEAKVEMIKSRSEIRLKKWNGEVNLGVRYAKVQGAGVQVGNRMEWRGAKEEVHAYPIDDENFEIEVVLKEKPDTNVFEFQLDNWQDLDFFYQPELTQAEIDEGASRPENVIGSYAVYHKTKANHRVGSTNYATGKAFHIYRPKAIDANGVETWAELSYLNGNLTVTVPQKFLDDAVYPVRVDPTFGYTSIGASNINIINSIRGSPGLISEGGTVTQISAYITNVTATKNAKTAVYAYVSAIDAGNIVQSSDQITSPVAAQWNDFPFTTQPLLTASTNYFMVAWAQTGTDTIVMHYDNVAGGAIRDNATYGTFPSPFAEDATNPNATYSIYATYTATATGGKKTHQQGIIFFE